jgi:hypothetical protein
MPACAARMRAAEKRDGRKGTCRPCRVRFRATLDYCFGIMAILEMRVLDGLRAVNELAAYRPLCSWATQLVPPEIVLMPRL